MTLFHCSLILHSISNSNSCICIISILIVLADTVNDLILIVGQRIVQ